MLKAVKRYIRDHFEKKIINKKEKVDNPSKPKLPYCCTCNNSCIPRYLKSVNGTFNYHPFCSKYNQKKKFQDESDTFKTDYVDFSWIETIGLSGTLAFGWTLSQNIDLKRRKTIQGLIDFYQNEKCYPLKRVFCPYYTLKRVIPVHVLTQPNSLIDADLLIKSSQSSGSRVALPVYGPPTAEEALNKASEGLKNVRNTAAGELENRLGLRCMSKQRYRKAIIHFTAGSALQNNSAAYNLAQCYELGLGTPQDFTKAAECYYIASDLGNATATFNLAVFHAQGIGGLKRDLRKARELLEKAVKLGDSNAKLVKEYLFQNKDSLYFENKVIPISQSAIKQLNEKSNCKEKVDVISSFVKPTLTTLHVPFAVINQNEIINAGPTIYFVLKNINDSESSLKHKNAYLKNESCTKLDIINEEYVLYNDCEKLDISDKLPLCYDVSSNIIKKEFESFTPFTKLYKMAVIPGHYYRKQIILNEYK